MPKAKGESLGDSYPAFVVFGVKPRSLNDEESAAATPDERIASVWRYLVGRAITFRSTIRPNERAHFDVEDILVELYCTLREKDEKWNPERGKYITFAGKITDRALSDIRDRSHTVEGPRNVACRMKEYQAEEDSGQITERRAKTFGDIRRITGQFAPIEGDMVTDREPAEESFGERENARLARDAVVWGLMELTAFESYVIGHWSGLWGLPPQTIAEIASETNRGKEAVKRAKESAVEKIRIRLHSMGHPAVASEN